MNNNNINLNGYNIPINSEDYFDSESIQINPKGALIISGFLLPLAFIGASLTLFGLGSTVKAIGNLSTTEAVIYTAAIVFMVGAAGDYTMPQEDQLTSQDAAVIHDSFRFAFDLLKAPAEKLMTSVIEEVSVNVAKETILTGEEFTDNTPFGLD